MAFFGITVEKIGRVWAHSNADKLELASCEGLGFQFCVGKGVYQAGTEVLYFPIDTVLPEEFKEKIGIKAPGRIKTIQLRGEYSQGFVFPLAKATEIFGKDFKSMPPEEITLFFRATKYDPPQKFISIGELLPLPEGQGIYDIENVDRFLEVFNSLQDVECVVTEKMEGTNISVCRYDSEIIVCQRANAIREKDGAANAYWEAARQSGMIDKIKNIPGKSVVLMGEMIGPSIQSNIYKLDRHTILIFDIKIDGRWLAFDALDKLCKEHDLKTVPLLARGKLKEILAGKTLDDYADGFSTLLNTLREGVVVKPVIEQFHPELRRVILKKHSRKYKSKEE